jgi:site-specific recombinase XerD
VFTTTVGTPLDGPTVTKHLHRLLARAELPDLTFHDLCHVYGSTLVAEGVSLKVVAELLGHRDAALTLRTYSHALSETKRHAVHRLDAIVRVG